MITAGIDMGAQAAKAVILKESKVAGQAATLVGWDTKAAANRALEEACRKAGIDRSQIQKTVATGVGRRDVPFANDFATEITAAAKGVNFLFPSARTIIDIGAEESRGIKCDGKGKVLDFAKNDKCAAGVGSFVEAMARALEIKLEDMGPLSLNSTREIPVNVTCVVFAESEVVSLIHSRTEKADIARAIHDAIATRTTSMVRRVGLEKEVALIGGTAKNAGVVASLRRHLGMDNLLVPEEPQMVGALGAALLAQS